MEQINKEKEKVPAIRFKGFNDAWEQRRLKDISKRIQGNDGRMDLPTLTISAGNGWMRQEDRFSANIAGNEQKNYSLLKKGDLSYNHGNSKLAKYGAVFELTDYSEALVPRVYHSFRMIKGSSVFIDYLFKTGRPNSELRKLISSGARMDGLLNISYEDFNNITLFIPDEDEQFNIGAFFRQLDSLITLHQRKCDQLKNVKKSLLEKMFPKDGEVYPDVRFKNFTDAWEQRRLGDTVQIIMGQSPNGETYSNVPNQYILIQGNADLQNGWVIPRVWTSQMTKKAESGDLIMSVRAPAGAMGKTAYDAVIGRGVAAIKGNEFIYQLLVKRDEEGYWKSLSSGSTFESLNSDDIKKAIIFVPDKIEQDKIGNILLEFDALITLHQRKLDDLKEFKNGLLQQMFI